MLNLIVTGASFFFPGGRALHLIKKGLNITNSTNPLVLGKNITLTVVDCCAPPPLKLVAHCVAATSLVTASVINPNPLTLGSAIHIITEIYEIC